MVEIPTKDEWLKVLEEVLKERSDESGLTTREIADVWGLGLAATRVRMGKLARAGVLERSGQKRLVDLAGRLVMVPSYRVKGLE